MFNLEKLTSIEAFRPIIQDLKKTKKSFLKIILKESKTLPWDSKVAAFPYLEKIEAYPKNSKGEYLRLLAQINFAQAPKLENFPESGILQFFILPDENFGLDWDEPTKQENFRIIYHKNIIEDENKLVKDFSFLPELIDENDMPVIKEQKMTFIKEEEYLNPHDFRFEKFGLNIYTLDDKSFDLVYDILDGTGNKIGAYPAFSQDDVRYYKEESKLFDTLLFQLDSNFENEIMWGDMGIANFFIKSKNLKKLDFSEVLYNWDCY